MLNRLFVGVHGARSMARLEQVGNRLFTPVAQPVVVGDQADVIVDVASVASFEVAANPAMQLAAAGVEHRLVGDFLDQRVAKHMHALGLDSLDHGHVAFVRAAPIAAPVRPARLVAASAARRTVCAGRSPRRHAESHDWNHRAGRCAPVAGRSGCRAGRRRSPGARPQRAAVHSRTVGCPRRA